MMSVRRLMLLAAFACSLAQAAPTGPAAKSYEAGLAAKRSGQLEFAAEALAEAVRLAPDDLDVHWALAWVHAQQRWVPGAVREFEQVQRLAAPADPKVAEAKAALERLRVPSALAFSEPRALQDGEQVGRGGLWDPSGKFAMLENDAGLLLLDLAGGVSRTVDGGRFPIASPDGSYAAISMGQERVVLEVATGKTRPVGDGKIIGWMVQPNGPVELVINRYQDIAALDPTTGRVRVVGRPGTRVLKESLISDGRWLYMDADGNYGLMLNTRSGAATKLIPPPRAVAFGPTAAVSPSGAHVAWPGWDDQPRGTFVQALAAGTARKVGPYGACGWIAGADQGYILAGDGVYRFTLAAPQAECILAAKGGSLREPLSQQDQSATSAASSSGRWVLAVHGNRTRELLRVRDGKVLPLEGQAAETAEGQDAWTGVGDLLVVRRDVEGAAGWWLLTPDDPTQAVRLADIATADRPVLSPDGNLAAYGVRRQDGDGSVSTGEVVVVSADGQLRTAPLKVAAEAAMALTLDWSPDSDGLAAYRVSGGSLVRLNRTGMKPATPANNSQPPPPSATEAETPFLAFEAEDGVATAPAVVHEEALRDRTPRGRSSSGRGYLELAATPAGADQPRRGQAAYRVQVPAAGTYTLWVRTMWKQGKGNDLEVVCNGQPAIVLGGDQTYDAWHWVKLAERLTLPQGPADLTLAARGQQALVDQLALTTSDQSPSGSLAAASGALAKP